MFEYRTKASRRKYLWGGKRIEVSLESSLVLNVRVDDDGEPVVIGVLRLSPRREVRVGELSVGESMSIPLDGIAGVFAECLVDTFGNYADSPIDTFVRCSIVSNEGGQSAARISGHPGFGS